MTANAKPPSSIDQVLSLVDSEMKEVSSCIKYNLQSDVALINQLGAYIIQAGGKRLRPVILLLGAQAAAESRKVSQHAITLAAIVEFIHTATLLHDDVVDESALRRGQETANEVFGNAASVLVGDYLYSRSFEMMVSTNNLQVMALLAQTTNRIAEGEVMQLLNVGVAETNEQQYIETIQSKTAILFAAAAKLGAITTSASDEVQRDLYAYGLHLGTAFQLVDDILDYSADTEGLGKTVGDDLAEGKPTLPLIHALKTASSEERSVLIDAITNADRTKFGAVLNIIKQAGSLEYTQQLAELETQKAKSSLQSLKDSEAKQGLIELAEHALTRLY